MSQQDREVQRACLQEHFSTLTDDEQLKGWDDSWKKSITPWDRGRPNPALEEALVDKSDLSNSALSTGGRKKALVPGCGRGPDVLLFASYGFDAFGVDASETAIEAANAFHREQNKEQKLFPTKDEERGRGGVKFICADFFGDNSWLPPAATSGSNEGPFDLIYDYTFLCALPPSLRPKWAARMSELLSPGGTLIAMEFPIGKDPKLGGPPHGLQDELYDQLLAHPGREVQYSPSGHVSQDQSGGEPSDNALVRISTWKPRKTFEGTEKSTLVSLWRHKK